VNTFLIVFTFYFTNSEPVDLSSCEWLLGAWRRDGGNGVMYEKWTKVSPRTFEGDSYLIKESEIIPVDFLRLEVYGDPIFYIAKVAHNNAPVPFRMIAATDSSFICENQTHDFPQQVIYKRIEAKRLHARVQGTENEKKDN